MATPPVTPTSQNLRNHYEMHARMLQQYLDLVLKFNIFYYAATGGILSYYFSKQDLPVMRYALVFPVLMSCVFGGLFFYAAKAAIVL